MANVWLSYVQKFPIVSFTFDDFPRTAARAGGAILGEHAMHGTYYVSLGLMNRHLPAGRGFSAEDLRDIVDEGHELDAIRLLIVMPGKRARRV